MRLSLHPENVPQTATRDPNLVMRLDRLGASFPTRLSFMRRLIRALIAEKASVERKVWEMDAGGHGRAVLSVSLGGHVYSLIAYSNAIPDEARTDRVELPIPRCRFSRGSRPTAVSPPLARATCSTSSKVN